jgi:pectate lyase
MKRQSFINRIFLILSVALLFVILPNLSLIAQDGFGRYATGGAGGGEVKVSDSEELLKNAASSSPCIIIISGRIELKDNVNIGSNKTIEGADSAAIVIGDLKIGSGAGNVIVRNLNISNPDRVGDGDGITITDGAKNIFIDHCTFTDCADGSCDISRQADSVTISWCRFRYLNRKIHRYVNLIGSGNSHTSDLGKLHVTLHHCWYDQLCNQRLPSVRFGRVHVYNNYFSSDSALYCVRTRLFAECLVENNFFENVRNPWELAVSKAAGTVTGKLRASGNNVAFMDTSVGVKWVDRWYEDAFIIQKLIPGTDSVFTPPYSYATDRALDVKRRVMAGAGNSPRNR